MLSSTSHNGWIENGAFANRLDKRTVDFLYFFCLSATTLTFLIENYFVEVILQFFILVFFRYFFVYLRYRSVGRGGGAPAFMSYWIAFYNFLLQLTINLPSLSNATLALASFDIALIMASAGIYKYRSGYLKGRGIEYGLVNEMWSRFPKFWKLKSPKSLSILLLNLLSIVTELIIALTVFTPKVSLIAPVLLFSMFVILQGITKLGSLCLTMCAVSCVLLLAALKEISIYGLVPWHHATTDFASIFISLYALLLFLSFLWNWSSFLGKTSNYPEIVKRLFRFCSVCTGSIIWSVFSANHTEILIRDAKSLKPMGDVHLNIALTSLVSHSRYFPSKNHEWEERAKALLRSIRALSGNGSWTFHIIEKKDSEDYWSELFTQRWKLDIENSLMVEKLRPDLDWNDKNDGVWGPKTTNQYGDYS